MKQLLMIVMVCLFPTFVYAGFFTSYDESKAEKVKGILGNYQTETSLEKKAQSIDNVQILYGEILANCVAIQSKFYLAQCKIGLDYVSNGLAITRMDYAERLVNAGRKDEAIMALKNIIITYSSGEHKSYAKKAEFMLEDLKGLKETSNSVSAMEIEKLRLQLEIEKVKLEQDKLKK